VHEYNISSILRPGTAVHKSFEHGLAEATRTTNPLARDVNVFSYDYDSNVLNHAGSEINSSSAPFSTTAVSFCCATSASIPEFSGLHWLPPYVPVAGGGVVLPLRLVSSAVVVRLLSHGCLSMLPLNLLKSLILPLKESHSS
jgi:hypothetical protein